MQEREPLGRLYSFMLCGPGQLYFIPRLILQNTNSEEMQADILAFYAGAVSRSVPEADMLNRVRCGYA